ncbi:MAG: hypothetical protein MI723_05080, partial [Caulobacterales bacterium]|nr:hypothetical protein [Caulobacterales bacterium]
MAASLSHHHAGAAALDSPGRRPLWRRALYWLAWKPFFHALRPALLLASLGLAAWAASGVWVHARDAASWVPSATRTDRAVRVALKRLAPRDVPAHAFWSGEVAAALSAGPGGRGDIALAKAWLAVVEDVAP